MESDEKGKKPSESGRGRDNDNNQQSKTLSLDKKIKKPSELGIGRDDDNNEQSKTRNRSNVHRSFRQEGCSSREGQGQDGSLEGNDPSKLKPSDMNRKRLCQQQLSSADNGRLNGNNTATGHDCYTSSRLGRAQGLRGRGLGATGGSHGRHHTISIPEMLDPGTDYPLGMDSDSTETALPVTDPDEGQAQAQARTLILSLLVPMTPLATALRSTTHMPSIVNYWAMHAFVGSVAFGFFLLPTVHYRVWPNWHALFIWLFYIWRLVAAFILNATY